MDLFTRVTTSAIVRVPVISKVPVEVNTIAATDYGPSVLSPHSVVASTVLVTIGVYHRSKVEIELSEESVDCSVSTGIVGDLIDEVEDCGDGEPFSGVDSTVSVDGLFVDAEVVADLNVFDSSALVRISHGVYSHVRIGRSQRVEVGVDGSVVVESTDTESCSAIAASGNFINKFLNVRNPVVGLET